MLKKHLFYCLLFVISINAYAKEYQIGNINNGAIHVTTIKSSWCFNLAVSTKVGTTTDSGKCNYVKETAAQGFDSCNPLQLNGAFLEKNAGSGFNCAATHVVSNGATLLEGIDEYKLMSDENGHYITTIPNQGHIDLK
jgi:hypothetical protein